MLSGKTAIITGASRGIGEAIAYKLASMGADIAAVSTSSSAERVCEKCRDNYGVAAKAYQCDVSSFEDVKKLVAQIKSDFHSVDILVNNAGITIDGIAARMNEYDFDRVIAVNLKGAFNLIRHCSGIFIRNKCGCIINISSISGISGNAGQSNYSASKAGLIGLTKSIAKELAPRGVRCNAIAPGFIETEMTSDITDKDLENRIPLGRKGSVEDIAQAAAYLAEAEYVTGVVLRVDGGIGM